MNEQHCKNLQLSQKAFFIAVKGMFALELAPVAKIELASKTNA
jgi:hypothetical protein